MEVREWLLDEIIKLGVEYTFLVPGMEIDPLCAAMGAHPKLKYIVACHEEGAGFMADGYSRVKNQIGLCMAIGAPGAANTIPAILNANADCSKVLYLTGGSPTEEAGRATFQNSAKGGTNDSEIISLAARYSQICDLPQLVPLIWRNAIKAIESDVPGPAHITIPQDLQTQEMKVPELPQDYSFKLKKSRVVDLAGLETLIETYLKRKSKILLLIGRGAEISNAAGEILTFIEKYNIPFSESMGGKGILPETHPLYIGLLGYAGLGRVSYACHKRALDAVLSPDLDVVINVGSSLSFFMALYRDKKLKPSAELVQLDLAPEALGRDYPVDLEIQGDAKACMAHINNQTISELAQTAQERSKWIEEIKKQPLFYQEERMETLSSPIDPAYLLHSMNKAMPDNTILFIDTGVHSPIAGHYWICGEGGSTVYPSNLGPMGFSIPGCIGGKLAAPDQTVVAIAGDGCMRMHGIEIMTAVHYNIHVIIIVSNNSALGKVYVRAKNANETAKDITLLSTANWADFAKSLGADGIRVEDPADLPAAYERALAAKGPFVIDVLTDKDIPPIL